MVFIFEYVRLVERSLYHSLIGVSCFWTFYVWIDLKFIEQVCFNPFTTIIARIKIQVPYVTVHRNNAKELFPLNFHFIRAFVGLVLSYYLNKQSITIHI